MLQDCLNVRTREYEETVDDREVAEAEGRVVASAVGLGGGGEKKVRIRMKMEMEMEKEALLRIELKSSLFTYHHKIRAPQAI